MNSSPKRVRANRLNRNQRLLMKRINFFFQNGLIDRIFS